MHIENVAGTKIPGTTKKEFKINFLKQLVPALETLEEHKIVHCDIKPANIIYNPVSKIFTLIDFGLSLFDETEKFAGKSFLDL